MIFLKKDNELWLYLTKILKVSAVLRMAENLITICVLAYGCSLLNQTKINLVFLIIPSLLILLALMMKTFFALKRGKLLGGLSSFFDYIFLQDGISAVIELNSKNNNKTCGDKFFSQIKDIKSFLKRRYIVALLDIPFALLLIILMVFIKPISAIIFVIFIFANVIINFLKNRNKNAENSSFSVIDSFFDNFLVSKVNLLMQNIINFCADKKVQQVKNYQNILCKKEIIKIAESFVSITSFICVFYLLFIDYKTQKLTFGAFVFFVIVSNWLMSMILHAISAVLPTLKTKNTFENLTMEIQKTKIMIKDVVFHKRDENKVIYNDLKGFQHSFTTDKIYNLVGNYSKIGEILRSICVGNENFEIKRFCQDNGYKNLAICPFEPFVFDAKIKNVISNFDEEIDEGKIKNLAQILNFEHLDINQNLDENEISKVDVKKINLASVIYQNPNILVLENPFKMLDKKASYGLLEILLTMQKLGKLIILTNEDFSGLKNLEIVENIEIPD